MNAHVLWDKKLTRFALITFNIFEGGMSMGIHGYG